MLTIKYSKGLYKTQKEKYKQRQTARIYMQFKNKRKYSGQQQVWDIRPMSEQKKKKKKTYSFKETKKQKLIDLFKEDINLRFAEVSICINFQILIKIVYKIYNILQKPFWKLFTEFNFFLLFLLYLTFTQPISFLTKGISLFSIITPIVIMTFEFKLSPVDNNLEK